MKEHPILFSTEMVKAILDGRKTQTRRVIRPQIGADEVYDTGKSFFTPDGMTSIRGAYKGRPDCEWFRKFPYGKARDTLWVRETWRPWAWWEGERWVFQYKDGCRLEARTADMDDEDKQAEWEERQWIKISEELTKAGHKPGDDDLYHFQGDPPLKWRPSIHMPRWASRINLEVTGVKVERVQDISADGAVNEGWRDGCGWERFANGQWFRGDTPVAVADFAYLWDSINAKRGYSWDSNPWAWVVEFKKL